MGCRSEASPSRSSTRRDYVLALKGNQGVLAAEVEEAFIEADAKDYGSRERSARHRRARPRAGGDAPLSHPRRSVRRAAQRCGRA
jgi:hypothetical protein